MKKACLDLTVSSIDHLNEKYVLIKLTSQDAMPPMAPGQFVEVKVDKSPNTFLRRPISIHNFDAETNELWLLVARIGDGTRQMGELHVGDTLNCVLPLGNGFTMPDTADKRLLLVGGGVGVAPLLYFGAEIKKMGGRPSFLLGARTKTDLLQLELFEALGDVYVTTEDGSYGERGFVTNHSVLQTTHFDQISCCGPKPMMKAVAAYATKHDVSCEVSLENMMACGLGACLCCVEKTIEGNLCVCKDGPVLNIKKLLWQV